MRNGCGNQVVVLRGCCPADCPETAEYTFNNINLSGVGPVDSSSNYTVNFRGVASANSMLTVTLDNVNHNALLTVDVAAIANAFRAANTTQTGILETATDAEAIAKAATDKIVTPSNLAALGASTTFAGFLEIATNAEVLAGVATNLSVVPSSLASRNFFSLTGGETNTSTGSVTLDLTAGGLIINGPAGTDGLFLNQAYLSLTDAPLNFSTGSTLQVNFTNLTDELLGANGASEVTGFAVSSFLSLNNTQSGYATFTNPATIRTCDTSTVTLPQLAQLVGTLISDLKLVKLPQS